MKRKKKLPLRPNVCMLVVNLKGKIFLGERIGEKGVWQFPQGGVEPKYSLRENVLKELHEELGAPKKRFKIIAKLKHRHKYEFRRVPKFAKGKWRGQKQTFWVVRFKGSNKDIDLSAHTPEFRAFKWCSVTQVRKLAEPIRLPGYEGALKEFERLALKR